MKRVLAWIVMAVLEFIMLNIVAFAASFVVRIYASIGQLNEGLFWLAVILGGSAVFGILISIMIWGNGLVVRLSEAVCSSTKGTRYTVLGSILLALYGFVTVATIMGATRGVNLISEIAVIINLIVFLVVAHGVFAVGEK